MRVLTVIAEMGSGGAEAVVHDLTSRLAADGVAVAVASNGGWRADRLAAAGIATPAVPLADAGLPAMLRSAGVLRRVQRSWRPDLVHTHNVRATAAVHAASLGRPGRHRPPLVTTVHGLADDHYGPAVRVLARASDVVVAVSDDVRERLVRAGLPAERVVVVENAVPDPRPEAPATRAGLAVPDGVPLVLCVARLAPPKRLDLLLDAWAAVPDAHLLVAGDGPDRAALERRGVSRVTFLGDRDDVGRLLAVADLLVLPSDREGLPMAVLEAMAAGVPVVASAVGGLRELDPSAVHLVAPGRAAALAGAVAGLLADPPRRAGLAARGQELVARRFSSAGMVGGYRNAYALAIGEGEPVVTKARP